MDIAAHTIFYNYRLFSSVRHRALVLKRNSVLLSKSVPGAAPARALASSSGGCLARPRNTLPAPQGQLFPLQKSPSPLPEQQLRYKHLQHGPEMTWLEKERCPLDVRNHWCSLYYTVRKGLTLFLGQETPRTEYFPGAAGLCWCRKVPTRLCEPEG